MKFQVCHISGAGCLPDYKIEEKLDEGWRPIGLVMNGANELLMYFQREKPQEQLSYFLDDSI